MTKYFADGRPAEVCGRAVRYDAGGRAHVVDQLSPAEQNFRRALIEAASEPTENLEAAEAILDPLLQASQADVARQMAEARQEIKDLRLALALIVGVAKTASPEIGLQTIVEMAGDVLLKTGRAI